MMKDLPPQVVFVLNRLRSLADSYLVGGCVRDHLLGRVPKDYDIATALLPDQVKPLFPKVIPTGERYGTVAVLVAGMSIEVTTFRADGNYSDGRRPDSVTFGKTIEEDLARRDFTINAMAWAPETGLIDPFGGLDDLHAEVIRAVGDPLERFREDALRMLRAIRFAVTLRFSLLPGLGGSIFQQAAMLENVSAERIRDELNKILLSPEPVRGINLLFKTDLLRQFLPELFRCYCFEQFNDHHTFDVFDHTLATLENTPAVLHLRLAALLHDIAKPETFTLVDGTGHFYGHEDKGAEMTKVILERLKYDRATIDKVTLLVKEHMFPDNMGTKATRRFIARVGAEHIPDLLELRLADLKGSGRPYDDSHVDRIRTILAEMETQGIAHPQSDLAVNGHDVMEALKIGPGPLVGKTLRYLQDKILENPALNNRESLLALMQMAGRIAEAD